MRASSHSAYEPSRETGGPLRTVPRQPTLRSLSLVTTLIPFDVHFERILHGLPVAIPSAHLSMYPKAPALRFRVPPLLPRPPPD